ncbi:hypothetical protein PHYBLDRAFT_157790 [Phycomyces blakesleeanus NRRL 1555(-)]|uniref:Uncharacterized protein n=1 Tax=Phycomyces blakesleeanus (strain ATCC 8743b / DSM 1359 / FGSC 10004 / NBRC 33097 / NRRL 1555) TaxID=763407 RepID=A0A167PAG2_PHYB8|nr:hypothetical protein PHYBLDRAFT_157790 [Phycomyces blakesleeanus NRRL 1555(-)]OAD77569.1 hypothetical protein PHYBLDRAFT_157790 [Phycomyces blakesleeanus NRRL 1555(-)]|eukprot:XP_018295609.1 hypothetical protein PHYBLDRAFT_157790 [Phycomyces blakesleeanus NRRL 1555(-)]
MFPSAKIRPLNHLQRQRITSNLFVVVALGAVLTVAAPTLFPCPAFELNDKAARLEAKRKLKATTSNIPVVIKERRPAVTSEEKEE